MTTNMTPPETAPMIMAMSLEASLPPGLVVAVEGIGVVVGGIKSDGPGEIVEGAAAKSPEPADV